VIVLQNDVPKKILRLYHKYYFERPKQLSQQAWACLLFASYLYMSEHQQNAPVKSQIKTTSKKESKIPTDSTGSTSTNESISTSTGTSVGKTIINPSTNKDRTSSTHDKKYNKELLSTGTVYDTIHFMSEPH
jgi:hypothetical protein